MSTRKELELAARKHYSFSTSAFAFVHVLGNGEQGLRLEAPDIMKVFTDSPRFGRDCQGNLYYHTLAPDFNLGRKNLYDVEYFRSASSGEATVVISLYREDKNNSYAKFIGPNPYHHSTVPISAKAGGRWDVLNLSDSTAVATLEAGSNVVELVVPSLRKKLEFAVGNVSLPPSFKFMITGKLATQHVDNLKTDQSYFVDYTNGRIYISESEDSLDATAVVMPFEIEYSPPHPGPLSFQTNTGRFSDL